jgi:transposase InsO family protein
VAANLLDQNFVADQPNQVWLTDIIIYVPTSQGWLYLAVILDLFTRKVVGWAMREHMRAELTIAALIMAIQRQRPGGGLIHHSDRGSQTGLKWSSQHPRRSCDDEAQAAFGSVWSGAIVLTRSSGSSRTR